MYLPLFLCLYESFWKGFESEQRRLIAVLLVWRVVNKTLKFRLTFQILLTVGVCSSNSLATRRGTGNLIYILAFIFLNLLTTSAYSTSTLLLLFSTY